MVIAMLKAKAYAVNSLYYHLTYKLTSSLLKPCVFNLSLVTAIHTVRHNSTTALKSPNMVISHPLCPFIKPPQPRTSNQGNRHKHKHIFISSVTIGFCLFCVRPMASYLNSGTCYQLNLLPCSTSEKPGNKKEKKKGATHSER